MTALTAAARSQRVNPRLRLATRAAVAVLVWAVAAVTVVMAHNTFAPISPAAALVAKTFVILLAGFAYMRLTRHCTVDHALFVGVAWLLFGIVTEVVLSTAAGRGWFAILGAPSQPYLRDVTLFAWVAAPALFARRRDPR